MTKNKENITKKSIWVDREKYTRELYLGEIIANEKPEWGSNNLILSPVGSGKSTLIEEELTKNTKGKMIWLVSNSALKEHVSPISDEDKKEKAAIGKSKRTYTSQNLAVYGDGDYEIHVMTYAEFGKRMFLDLDSEFTRDVSKIFCDEIHSLPAYHSYGNDSSLGYAMQYLFNKHENHQIFYFTATDENLILLEKKHPGVLKYVKTFDYREHPEIRKYITLSEYKINHISQIRPHLKARKKSFTKRGYKGLAFSRLISTQKEIAKIAEEEGLTALVLWSVNNEKYKMDEHQIKMRDVIIRTGLIPEPYNLLVINSSMQEGWDLDDEMVKLAIINTTNETEKIQALGRIRRDIDVLIYRTNEETKQKKLVVPEAFMNVELAPDDKEALCEAMDIKDHVGRALKWRSVQQLLRDQGYTIENKQMTRDRKRVRMSRITKED